TARSARIGENHTGTSRLPENFGSGLRKAHIDPPPGLIVGEMPLVTTASGVFGQQDGAWSECELLAEPRLELQGSAESDHVLANRSTMPIEARARRAFFERHLGRLPGPRSMCGALQLRQLESTVLEVRLVVVAGVEPDQGKGHLFFLRSSGITSVILRWRRTA